MTRQSPTSHHHGPDPDELDAHRDLLRLRVAGLLALLDGRRNIGDDDWRLAGIILAASDTNRRGLIADARLAARDVEDAAHAKAARREVTIRDTVANRATTAMAKANGRKVRRVFDAGHHPVKRNEMVKACNGGHRREGSIEEAIEIAEANGSIIATSDGFIPGESRPA